jgi:hypothetical protein
MMSGFAWTQFDPKVLTKKLIEGSFKTAADTDFSGYKYETSVNFTTKIQQAKLPEPLPDARTGNAFLLMLETLQKHILPTAKPLKKKDIAAIRKLFQMPAGFEATDEQMKESIEFLASAAPKTLKITKGYINASGDRVVVFFTGTEEAEKLYGTIGLIKKNDAWICD